MNFKFNSKLILTCLTVLPLILFCLQPVCAADDSDGNIVVIVNNNAPEKDLSKERIKQIYTGKVTLWSSNETIILCVLKDDEIHNAFLKQYVQRNATQFKNTWRQMIFTGKGEKPKSFDSIEKLIQFISDNRLAVGYITDKAIDPNVKIIVP